MYNLLLQILKLNDHHVLNSQKYQRAPSPPRPDCLHPFVKKNIFKNIHSKLGSVKIQVRMSCSARTNFTEIIYPSFEAKVMNPEVPSVSRLCCNPGKSIQDRNAHNSQKPRSIIEFLLYVHDPEDAPEHNIFIFSSGSEKQMCRLTRFLTVM